jgi:ankyrin repeat protein
MAAIGTADLLSAIVTGNTARLRRLLPPTGDPAEDDAPGMPDGPTPLMAAAACGHDAAVALLLQTGADPARRDARGRTAAAYARAAGHPHLAARLDTVVPATETMR